MDITQQGAAGTAGNRRRGPGCFRHRRCGGRRYIRDEPRKHAVPASIGVTNSLIGSGGTVVSQAKNHLMWA